MMRTMILTAILAAALALAACGEAGPEPDTERVGYIKVWRQFDPSDHSLGGSLVTLNNGDDEIQLVVPSETELVNFEARNGAPAWSPNAIYRAEGLLNHVSENMKNDDGTFTVTSLAGVDDWIWTTRIERLTPEEALKLTWSGELVLDE